jgi:hypothetical protein
VSKFKVGDLVRVRKPAELKDGQRWWDELDRFDGTVQLIDNIRPLDCVVRFAGDCEGFAFHFDWLELDEPMRSWVPDGYSVVEMAVPDAIAAAIGDGNALVWRPCELGERYLSSAYNKINKRTTKTDDFLNVIVSTAPPAPQYREPTHEDAGKMVEVRDREKEPWQVRELLAVIGDETIARRFVCRDLKPGVYCFTWGFARIKAEEVK